LTLPPTATLPLLGVVLIWGFKFPIMKVGFGAAHPLMFNAVRITISIAFLFVWARREPRVVFERHHWPQLLGLGVMGHLGYQVLFVIGLMNTSVGNAALLISSSPVWAALTARLLGERLGGPAWAGLATVCTGTAVIALGRGDVQLGGATLLGDALCIVAAMTWGAFSALARPFTQWIPPARFTAWTMLLVLPMLWGAALVVEPRVQWGATLVWTIAYSGLFATGVAYVLFNIGLKRVGAARATGFINLVPVISLATGSAFLGETVRSTQLLGGAFVIAGLWWMQRSRRTGAALSGGETATDRAGSGGSSSRG